MIVKSLRAFLAFHHRGTIAAAADDVHLSPAAVSVQLKGLEEQLGVALFVRTGRSIRLTAAGYQMLPQAERLLRAYDDLVHSVGPAAARGSISLGVVNNVLIGIFPRVMQRFMREHPDVQVKVSSGTSPELVAKLVAGVLDAAIVSSPPAPLDDDFRVHNLYAEPFALVTHAGAPEGTLAECIRGQPYIALDRNSWTGREIEEILTSRGIHAEPAMELNSQQAILSAVRAGLAASVLPVIRQAGYEADSQLRFTRIGDTQRMITLVERKAHVLSHLTAQVLSTIAAVAQEGNA